MVDEQMATLVLRRLFAADGLIREWNPTVIMATSICKPSSHYLGPGGSFAH